MFLKQKKHSGRTEKKFLPIILSVFVALTKKMSQEIIRLHCQHAAHCL